MIKAYVVGISTQIENEDIQIRYRIYKDEELICEKLIYREYKKPSLVNHFALLSLLKELKKYEEYDITVIINDAALYEQIRGTSTTKNQNVLKIAGKIREEISQFNGSLTIKDVSVNHTELMKWNEILRF